MGPLHVQVFQCSMAVIAYNVVMALVDLYVLPAFFVLTAVLVFIMMAVDRSNREIKRIANNCLSPVMSNMSEVRAGGT